MTRFVRYMLSIISFTISCVLGLLYVLLRPFHPTNSRWCAQTFSFFCLPVIGIRLQLHCVENYPTVLSFIVVANHQSNFD